MSEYFSTFRCPFLTLGPSGITVNTTGNIPPTDEWMVGNYCVCFIDLLGQRDALKGQTLLPPFASDEERVSLHQLLRNSVGAIIRLQAQAQKLLDGILSANSDSPLRAQLSPEDQVVWDEMQTTHVKMQRWSDGLMPFVCLGDSEIKCHVNGIFSIFGLAGSLCLIGLATHHPIRGAIEVAWGVELHEQELSGAAVARAYELESEIAQYPRIVVGPEAVRFLQVHASNPHQDPYSRNDQQLAKMCLEMLVQDVDGHWLLHYLGEQFQWAVSHDTHPELHSAARAFILKQLVAHQSDQNTKLAFRYSHLLQYFDAHQPAQQP